MTENAPQVGDTITTANELDALPIGTILAAVESGAPAGLDLAVRWSGSWRTDGAAWPIDPSVYIPLTILYLPGQPPRPERVVKAEALREAAAEIASLLSYGAELRHDGSEDPFIAAYADGLRESHTAVTQRADRIERGDA